MLCPLPHVLTYLQTLVVNSLAPTMTKMYAAVISSCQGGYGERTGFHTSFGEAFF